MRNILSKVSLIVGVIAFNVGPANAQTVVAGSSMPLNSLGSTTLSAPGYLGTYLTIPSGGATINFAVNATEGGTTGAGRT